MFSCTKSKLVFSLSKGFWYKLQRRGKKYVQVRLQMFLAYNVDRRISEKIVSQGNDAIKNMTETISQIKLGKNQAIS